MATTTVRTPSEYEELLQRYYFERSEESRDVRVGEKEVSEQAAIVARYADLFSRAQIEVAPRGGECRCRRRPRAAVPATEDVRGGAHLRVAGGAGGRDRERDPRLARQLPGRGAAVARGGRPARRHSLVCGPRRARRARAGRVGAPQPGAAGADHGLGGVRRGALGPARSGRAGRRGEGDLAPAPRGGARRCERCDDRLLGADARALVRPAPRPRAGPAADECPRAVPPPALAARVDLFEGALRRGLPRQRARARIRHDGDPEHPPRPRGPAAEEPAGLRHRLRPARGRAPDHARPGRPRRLPGLHARGGPRAPLRRRRPAAPVHLPPDLARPRADGDLLVHLRGGDARAGLARAPLRPLGRAGGGERGGDRFPRGAALPPLHGEAPLRARVLVELRRGARPLASRLLGAAHGRDGDPL